MARLQPLSVRAIYLSLTLAAIGLLVYAGHVAAAAEPARSSVGHLIVVAEVLAAFFISRVGTKAIMRNWRAPAK